MLADPDYRKNSETALRVLQEKNSGRRSYYMANQGKSYDIESWNMLLK